MLISIAQYYQGGESVCRNKAIQQMFMRLGAAEKAGSGADKILQGWKEANYRSPHIEETNQPDKVVLTLPLINLLSEDIIRFLKKNYGKRFNDFSHDELITLATCYSEGEVTNYRLQIAIDKHSADITKLLKILCDDNLLIPYGVGRGTKYKINEDHLRINANNTSIANNTSSNTSNSTSNNTSKTYKKSARKSPDRLRQDIIDDCTEFISLEEIARKVERSISHLKSQIIPQMLIDNLIERQFPDVPRHPHHKYRAIKK